MNTTPVHFKIRLKTVYPAIAAAVAAKTRSTSAAMRSLSAAATTVMCSE